MPASYTLGSTVTGYTRDLLSSQPASSVILMACRPSAVTSEYVTPKDVAPLSECGSTSESVMNPRGTYASTFPAESANSTSPPGPISAFSPFISSGNSHVVGAEGEESTMLSFTSPVPAVKLTVESGRTPG